MIECEVYDETGARVGGDSATFSFNTLPRIDEILWLVLHASSFEEETKQISCIVTYSAQLCESNSRYKKSKNIGYLTVKIDESIETLIKHKSLHSVANETSTN
jgi:hypothetical protein